MSSVLCVTCASRDPAAFHGADALLCLECAIRWAVCLDCDELFLVADSESADRCDGCVVSTRSIPALAASPPTRR